MGHEFDDVEQPFIDQCVAMGWQAQTGTMDDPALTGRTSFKDVIAEARGREFFISWYVRKAQAWFEKQTLQHSNRMDVNINEVKVQDLRFRWGSFGSEGRVSFHWKAALLPPRIAKYIIIHELAHAHHPDHSAKFWIKVEQHLPDWRARKEWLAENGMQVEGL